MVPSITSLGSLGLGQLGLVLRGRTPAPLAVRAASGILVGPLRPAGVRS